MKLRHQIFFLIATPIACQVASFAVVTAASSRVESAGRREIQAKQILTLSQEISGLLGLKTLQLSRSMFLHPKLPDSTIYIEENLKKLKELTRDNKQASKTVAAMEKSTRRLLKLLNDLEQAFLPGSKVMYFAQFISGNDFTEAATFAFTELRQESQDLRNIYEPLSREFQPTEIQARKIQRETVIWIVAANIAVITVLMIVVNAQTLNRLNQLMDNIHELSKGRLGTKRLEGDDELAELDRTFAEVTGERLKLEEIRKSMSAMVSHDLRSPLTAMTLTLDFMVDMEGQQLPEKSLARLRQLRSVADRLRRLTNTLLDIEKIESGKVDVNLDIVKVDKIIDAAVNAVMPLADASHIKLEFDCKPDDLCYCDEDRTVQVLVNLLSNAIKFAPVKSTVFVQVQSRGGEWLRIDVRDQGPGISAQEQARLFAKFSQLDQPEDKKKLGSGLGLYICKTLIEAQSGMIGVDSAPGQGTSFWFQLPIKPETQAQAEAFPG